MGGGFGPLTSLFFPLIFSFQALSSFFDHKQLKHLLKHRYNPNSIYNRGCPQICPYYKHITRSLKDWKKVVQICKNYNKANCYILCSEVRGATNADKPKKYNRPLYGNHVGNRIRRFCINGKFCSYQYTDHGRIEGYKQYGGFMGKTCSGKCKCSGGSRDCGVWWSSPVYNNNKVLREPRPYKPLPHPICEPPCEKKKSCECGPEVCENETCPAKVDCPFGGKACSLTDCPGKNSYPGFNIGNLILGNLPKTANKNLPPNTRVPLHQAGAVVHGALRVYVESFDDFKVCDKQGQCYKVCYSDGTNCPPRKKK